MNAGYFFGQIFNLFKKRSDFDFFTLKNQIKKAKRNVAQTPD